MKRRFFWSLIATLLVCSHANASESWFFIPSAADGDARSGGMFKFPILPAERTVTSASFYATIAAEPIFDPVVHVYGSESMTPSLGNNSSPIYIGDWIVPRGVLFNTWISF